MAIKKSRAELRTENKLLRSYNTSEFWASVINNAIKWAGLVFIFRYCYLATTALAGKETLALFDLKLIANKGFVSFISILFGISGCAYGGAQKKLRKDTVERLQNRVKNFEDKEDEKRSSSNLTPRGDTPKENL